MQSIQITIDKKGKTTVEAEGFTGPACQEKTQQILAALGPKRDEEFKPEFFACEEQTQQIGQ